MAGTDAAFHNCAYAAVDDIIARLAGPTASDHLEAGAGPAVGKAVGTTDSPPPRDVSVHLPLGPPADSTPCGHPFTCDQCVSLVVAQELSQRVEWWKRHALEHETFTMNTLTDLNAERATVAALREKINTWADLWDVTEGPLTGDRLRLYNEAVQALRTERTSSALLTPPPPQERKT